MMTFLILFLILSLTVLVFLLEMVCVVRAVLLPLLGSFGLWPLVIWVCLCFSGVSDALFQQDL